MSYLDLLIDSNVDPECMTLRERQATRLEEYTRRHKVERQRHAEEMRAAGDGASGIHDYNEEGELLGGNVKAPKGQFEIFA